MLIKKVLCWVFGHTCKKIPITDENYQNYITSCNRCKRTIKKSISKVCPNFTFNGKPVNWIVHNEVAL